MAAFCEDAVRDLLREVVVQGIGEEPEKQTVVLSYETQLAALQRQIQRLSAQPKPQKPKTQAEDNHDEEDISGSGSESHTESDSEEEEEERDGKKNSKGKKKGGSEDEDEEDKEGKQVGNHIHFQNQDSQWLYIFKDSIPSRGKGTKEEIIREIKGIPNQGPWAIFMLAAGHFAAAVFDKGEVTIHKCFHRYVVRAKAGTLQSVRDAKGGGSKIKSAGSGLRRYNEAALQADIRQLILTWKPHLDKCSVIFTRVSVHSRDVLFGGKPTEGRLEKHDARIRSIPFPTNRPTLKELTSVYARLATVYLSPGAPEFVRRREETEAKATVDEDKPKGTKGSAPPAADEVLSRQDSDAYADSVLFKAALKGDVEEVRALVRVEEVNYAWNDRAQTALHAAARMGHAAVVEALLDGGCDPTISNDVGQPPYDVSKDKETRNVFRRFMGKFPDAFDYKLAHIPSPLTAEMEEAQEQKQKNKAKNAKKKAAQKRRQKEKKDQEAKEGEESDESEDEGEDEGGKPKPPPIVQREHEVVSMKAALREQRAAAALARMNASKPGGGGASGSATAAAVETQGNCSYCGKGIPKDAMLFHRLTYKYCAMPCLTRHRQALES